MPEKDPDRRFQSAGDVRAALELDQAAAPRCWSGSSERRSAASKRGAAALLVVVIGAVLLNVGGLRDRLLTSPPRFDSIVVMPLKYTGNEHDSYLAGGIQQGLIDELAQLPAFTKVIAAGSTRRFRDSTATLSEIAKSLGAKALVTGSVVRTDDRVQVAAQLVDAADERQVWSQTFGGRPSIWPLCRRTSPPIAQAIEAPQARRSAALQRRRRSPATEGYLRGMHELSTVQDGGDASRDSVLRRAIDRIQATRTRMPVSRRATSPSATVPWRPRMRGFAHAPPPSAP